MKQFLLFFSLLFFVSATPAFAQTNDDEWTITNFHSDIVVESSGKVTVQEIIDVDYNNVEKHGIYRDIPIAYSDSKDKKTYTTIDVDSVTQDNKKAEYKEIKNESNLRIRIGDPDKTITGKHTYMITYTATGVLRSFTNYDELYWNVTGNNWDATIKKASATVSIPQDGIKETVCFEGYPGYTNPCSISAQIDKAVSFQATRELPQTQGMTIAVDYTKGMVPILTVAPPKNIWDELFIKQTITLFTGTIFAGIAFIIALWMKGGRDLWFKTSSILDPNAKAEPMPLLAHETKVVSFEPPAKLRPAEIGVLMDEKADTLDITATIIDLAYRGYLTITEIEKKWVFGSKDYELHRTEKIATPLLSYEKFLLDRLFATGKTIKMSALKTSFYTDLAKVKEKVYEELMRKKLFVTHPESTRNKYTLLAVLIIAAAVFGVFAGFNLINAAIVSICAALCILGIILLFTARTMPRRTALGREYYQQAKGYYMFINGAEKYRQQFFEKKSLFNEILPYSIVFGLTGKFAKAMKDMGIKSPEPTWYTGTHAFVPAVFASDVHGFSNSLSSAMAATPASSGSSGGSSGGGFGGGGGGSW